MFLARHLGPSAEDVAAMLAVIGAESLESLCTEATPAGLALDAPLDLPHGASETEVLEELARIAGRSQARRPFLGMGFHRCLIPEVIRRGVLENPAWLTAYTPYQAEISQGRLTALLAFQTIVRDLTGMEVANASLLDEATAAAEAMTLCRGLCGRQQARRFLAATDCHPQTLAVLRTRAQAIDLEVEEVDPDDWGGGEQQAFGLLLQNPATDGRIRDLGPLTARAKAAGLPVVVATDLLACTLIAPPAAADVVVGSSQRLGCPLGGGGPHAGFLATRLAHLRRLPGRLVGVSRDARGQPALRLTLQTREQHIRRERASSNICTAQALPAILSALYCIHHGPEGLTAIAERIHRLTTRLAAGLLQLGYEVAPGPVFDTLRIDLSADRADLVLAHAAEEGIDLRRLASDRLAIALDEATDEADLTALLAAFHDEELPFTAAALAPAPALAIPGPIKRTSSFMVHRLFHDHRSEAALVRLMRRWELQDYSLCDGMIPLGSCTMKLNSAASLRPLGWPAFIELHPAAPAASWHGLHEVIEDLIIYLGRITGLPAVSLQPNAGSQGEFAGLLTIRGWHAARGQAGRRVCLIPSSAHGTNPASAVLAGLEVIGVRCAASGEIDLGHLSQQADRHADRLAALMITYPSTHGVFEDGIRKAIGIVHAAGGLVYCDGANLNALAGLVRPSDLGADVCHLNLHKTFGLPHGGGGPGVGPVCARQELASHLPGHPLATGPGLGQGGAVSAGPWGSASLLPIAWVYLSLLGGDGLASATRHAILAANYVAHRLRDHYPILYSGPHGRVAHECILDLRAVGADAEDVAKRLMDYGFHAPTLGFPVPGTLMVEPTESEPKAELDRFCAAMIAIRAEIRAVAEGRWPAEDNPLVNAPHPIAVLTEAWSHPYDRATAVFPAGPGRTYFPPVARVDNVAGDRQPVLGLEGLEGMTQVS